MLGSPASPVEGYVNSASTDETSVATAIFLDIEGDLKDCKQGYSWFAVFIGAHLVLMWMVRVPSNWCIA